MAAKRKRQGKKSPITAGGKGGQPMVLPDSTPPSQQVATLPLPDVSQVLREIEAKLESKVIAYYLNEGAQINDDAMIPLYKQLQAIGNQKRLNLFIHSRGGATETPWKIIEMFRNFCEYFAVLVAYRAHSAATHIALGANEVVMTAFAELGPVDPYRTHPLLPTGPDDKPISISVQDMKHCISFIKREAEMPYTPEALAQLFAAMFEKIHPLAMGAIEQSYALSQIISEKALATHMDTEKDKEKIREIAQTLLDGYKSHRFQIGRLEARKLGLPVVDADPEVGNLLWSLYELYSQSETASPTPVPNARGKFRKIVGYIDSVAKRFAHMGLFEEEKPGFFKAVGGAWEEISLPPQSGMTT